MLNVRGKSLLSSQLERMLTNSVNNKKGSDTVTSGTLQ